MPRLSFGFAAALAAASASALGAFPAGALGYGPLHTKPKGWRRINRLNRSRRWAFAETYAEARALSPYPNRPVR